MLATIRSFSSAIMYNHNATRLTNHQIIIYLEIKNSGWEKNANIIPLKLEMQEGFFLYICVYDRARL